MKLLGVITGDIVESREIGTNSRKRLFLDLKRFLDSLEKKEIISGYELFRGDSFQCAVQKKEFTLRAALIPFALITGLLTNFLLKL